MKSTVQYSELSILCVCVDTGIAWNDSVFPPVCWIVQLSEVHEARGGCKEDQDTSEVR